MDKKKLVFAQLCADAIEKYIEIYPERADDALWIMSGGVGDAEEHYENLEKMFGEVIGIAFSEAEKLNEF